MLPRFVEWMIELPIFLSVTLYPWPISILVKSRCSSTCRPAILALYVFSIVSKGNINILMREKMNRYQPNCARVIVFRDQTITSKFHSVKLKKAKSYNVFGSKVQVYTIHFIKVISIEHAVYFFPSFRSLVRFRIKLLNRPEM